jgi:hypothetical protein
MRKNEVFRGLGSIEKVGRETKKRVIVWYEIFLS